MNGAVESLNVGPERGCPLSGSGGNSNKSSVFIMGVDIGSSTSKCVILRSDEGVCASSIFQGGTGTSGPEKAVNAALEVIGISQNDVSGIAATGYGRNTFKLAGKTFSELSCHARGARFLNPNAQTVIDIGGQDCKAMLLDKTGRLDSFAMNDKCAAGTGRFLEVMARILETDLSDFGELGEQAEIPAEITSTCTVFAESEIISQLSKGADKRALIAGVHRSVAVKAAAIAKRLTVRQPVFFTGGVSQNIGVLKALARELGANVETDARAQLAGALGAALLMRDELKV